MIWDEWEEELDSKVVYGGLEMELDALKRNINIFGLSKS